jgi:hypothetical protein
VAIGTPVLGTPSQTTAAGTTDATPAYPATDADDLMLLLGASSSGSGSIFTNPSGWTLDDQSSSNSDTQAPSILGSHKLATGSETGTLSVAHGSTVCSVGIVGLAGVDATAPVASATLLDQSAGASSWQLPNVTVPSDGSTLLYVASGNNTTSTFTPPTGWTELWDGVSQLVASRCWSIGYKQNVAAGSLGTSTNLGVSNSIRGLVIVYVINPAASSVTRRWNGSAYVSTVRRQWNGTAYI